MSKSDGVADIVKWMEGQIKEQKKRLDEVSHIYDASRFEEQTRLNVMVSWKISTEKYMKKLRHEGN